MSERLVNVDRETPMLPPVDLRNWVPEDDMVRYLTGDAYPDHDTICAFRRKNKQTINKMSTSRPKVGLQPNPGPSSTSISPIRAVVHADESQLILAEHVSRSPGDAGELGWAWNTMSEKTRSDEGRRIHAKRESTVEPTFGIIEAPMGFRQFLLRGTDMVNTSGRWSALRTIRNRCGH